MIFERIVRKIFRDIILRESNFDKYLSWICERKFNSWTENHKSQVYSDRFKLYDATIQAIGSKAVNYLEFGVYQGASLMYFVDKVKSTESRFYGFDSFQGLPEKWGSVEAGGYSSKGMKPEINDSRVELVEGLFQKTLNGFLQNHLAQLKANGKIIHLDADLYSSTLFVLTQIHSVLETGDILIFDEFGYNLIDEFRAFADFCDSFYLNYKLVGQTKAYSQIAIQIQ